MSVGEGVGSVRLAAAADGRGWLAVAVAVAAVTGEHGCAGLAAWPWSGRAVGPEGKGDRQEGVRPGRGLNVVRLEW